MNKQKLIETLSVQTCTYNQWRMFSYIIRNLKRIGCEYYTCEGNIYVTKGSSDIYPCIVAHMDTVHEIEKDLVVVEISGNLTGFNPITMSQIGIGGDDKVGIYIALEVLEKTDNIKAVFFRDEEIGCEGSGEADIPFFHDCSFVLQCDRKGNKDFISNIGSVDLSSDSFKQRIKEIMKNYNYKFAEGMMTDVLVLKENGLPCSCANISCGYYNPHNYDEYVNIHDVSKCLSFVLDIINDMGKEFFPHLYKKRYSKNYHTNQSNQLWEEELSSHYTYKKGGGEERFFHDKYERLRPSYNDDFYCEGCSEFANVTYSRDFNMNLCKKCINYFE